MTRAAQRRHPVRRRLKQAGDVELRSVDAEHFLLSPKHRTIHHVNDMGFAIWRFFAQPRSHRELHALLEAAFPDVPADRLRRDGEALCDKLESEGLLRRMK